MRTIDNLTHTFLLYTKATKRKGDERGCIKQPIPRKYLHYVLNFIMAWAVWTKRDPVVLPSVGKQHEKKKKVFVRKQLHTQHIWGSQNKPQRMLELIFWPYFLLHLSKLTGVNIFQYNKRSLLLLFGFQSYIWEWISILHWSFKRLADSYVLACRTSNSMDKISTVIRTWLRSASKCFIPSVNLV